MRHAFAVSAAALCAGLFSQGAGAACYVVYGPAQQVVYRSSRPPVDLSYRLHETVPALAPGATLVFSPDNHGCESEINLLAAQGARRAADPGRAARAPRAPRG